MTERPQLLPLASLTPHPGNPRLAERTDVIEQLTALIREQGFDAAHAIMVRPHGNAHQIVSGHNRVKAALAAGLETVWSWVREMTDDEAYMQLVLANTQGELSAVERGIHALNSGKSIKDYAESVGREKERVKVQREVMAARVAMAVFNIEHDKIPHHALIEIHAAKPWLWPALVSHVIHSDPPMTVEKTREKVQSLKEAPEKRGGFSWDRVAEHVVADSLSLGEVEAMLDTYARYVEQFGEKEIEATLAGKNVSTPSQLTTALKPLEGEVWSEEAQKRALPLFAVVSLKHWHDLDCDTRRILLDPTKLPATGTFNRQHGDGIEWAQWSWNPITGCLHDCPYCYARDIATLGNTARAFPHGFAPALKPVQLNSPQNMRPPRGAERDQRLRNVFCGSMSDWWGRWVPEEWINAVLGSIRAAPWWTFLTLTKFPKRMAEFDLPPNIWAGTTIDLQARVRNAEAAFADIRAGYRWASIEPFLENLRFTRIEVFDWFVIGGASSSSRSPEWKPPFAWIIDFLAQANEAGIPVYMKPNLLGHRILQMPGGLPVPQDYPAEPPAVFDYLRDKRTLEAKALTERRRAEESA